MADKTITTWQPIDTAPKDGTIVLVVAKFYNILNLKNPDLSIRPAKYSTFDGYWRVTFPINEDININPDYWMPLPEMPK